MKTLSSFLAENAMKMDSMRVVVSERFKNPEGEPVEWEIVAITSAEDKKLRADCMKKVPVPGQNGNFNTEFDFDTYVTKLAVHCTVFPNLLDAELQDSYGVMGAENLLTEMLSLGEYVKFRNMVYEVNGLTKNFDQRVQEAKN